MPMYNPVQSDVNRGRLVTWSVQKNYCEFNGSVLTCYAPIYSYYYALGVEEKIAKTLALIPATPAEYQGAAAVTLPGVEEATQSDFWKTVIMLLTCANLGIAIANLPNHHYFPDQPAEIWPYPTLFSIDSPNSPNLTDISYSSGPGAAADLIAPATSVVSDNPITQVTSVPESDSTIELTQPLDPSQTTETLHSLSPSDSPSQTETPAAPPKTPAETPTETPTKIPAKTPAAPKPKATPSPGSSAKRPSPAVIREELSRIAEITTADLAALEPVIMECTAYTHTGSRTATGVMPRYGVVAVDPKVIPLGSQLYVVGYGPAIAADTGGLIKGNIIDIFLDSEATCRKWGRRKVQVYILRKGV